MYVLSGGCFELIDGWGLLFGCHLLTGGYCVGSFVYWVNWWLLCGIFCGVCCCRGFGAQVDELELVGVVWDEVVCVDLGGLLCGVFRLFC